MAEGAVHSKAHDLRARWLERAFEHAGIDASHWDPARGTDANRRTIECVYDYYGRLYERDARLQWAGMAKLIGPSFYAGFLDIGVLPDTERRLLALAAAGRKGVDTVLRRSRSEDEVAGEGLGFFETTFLTMQRKIFEDQAVMHEAYLAGGVDATRALGQAGILDDATARAWNQIDGGGAEAVREGNRTLLYREQHDIIDRFYSGMRAYDPPQGEAFTYLFTLAGSPAIPGAKGYTAVYPLAVTAPVPGGELTLRTPLARGNIAAFADRWELIDGNTLPAFDRLLSTDPDEALELIATPIARRVGRFRMMRRLGSISKAALTHWQVRFESERAAPEARRAGEAEVTIDLTRRPAEERVWDGAGDSFPLAVLLPGGRRLSTTARLAVLVGPTRGGAPNRLTVKLPPTDLDGARATLADWGADAGEVERWADAAARASLDAHAYSTRVFRADPSGSIRRELQAEHHLDDDTYVVDALFSWDVNGSAGPAQRAEASRSDRPRP